MDKLDIYSFGRQLIETGDLDPVYIVLWQAKENDVLTETSLAKYLIAYWCFYHMGTAAWICNTITLSEYWKRMNVAAASKDYPRSSERRHFRGQAATTAVFCLEKRKQTPTEIIASFTSQGLELNSVMTQVKELRNFGPWIAFKVADMLERLAIAPVIFSPSDVFQMFDSPAQGAGDMAKEEGQQFLDKDKACNWASSTLKRKLGILKSPPRLERIINIQEIETILCKYHSHISGHYEIGKDIREVKHGLELFTGRARLATHLLAAGKSGGLW